MKRTERTVIKLTITDIEHYNPCSWFSVIKQSANCIATIPKILNAPNCVHVLVVTVRYSW